MSVAGRYVKPIKKVIPSRQVKAITLAYMPGGVQGALHAGFIIIASCLFVALAGLLPV